MIYAGDVLSPFENADSAGIAGGESPAASKSREKPLLVCLHSGKALEEDRLMRFVIGPENLLYPDFAGDLPGQPLWCSLYRATLQEAVDNNSFAAFTGQPVVIPGDIMEQVARGLRHQALAMVSMARKAGHLVTGAEKTEQVLRSGKAGIYLTAAQKDADTRLKLTFLAGQARIVDLFTSEELSTASGANKVVHAAMTRGGTTERFFTHVKRINLFRPSNTASKQTS